MSEQIHVLATFESLDAAGTAMKGAISWVRLTDAEAIQLLQKPPEPDLYADPALRPGLNKPHEEKSDG